MCENRVVRVVQSTGGKSISIKRLDGDEEFLGVIKTGLAYQVAKGRKKCAAVRLSLHDGTWKTTGWLNRIRSGNLALNDLNGGLIGIGAPDPLVAVIRGMNKEYFFLKPVFSKKNKGVN